MMLGHCAGLRNSQSLGDYVLAHAYVREDNVLYKDLHPAIPIPALSEIQLSLEQAVSEVTGYQGYDLKKLCGQEQLQPLMTETGNCVLQPIITVV